MTLFEADQGLVAAAAHTSLHRPESTAKAGNSGHKRTFAVASTSTLGPPLREP